MITILSVDPSFGGSQYVKEALAAVDTTTLICTHPDKWRGRPAGTIDYLLTAENADFCAQIVRASRLVFLVGGSAVKVLEMLPENRKWAPALNLVSWVTDSYYRKNSRKVNGLLKLWHCDQMFILPDDTLYPLVPSNTIPLYHPQTLRFLGEPKTQRVSVMHSPGTGIKRKQKRSVLIEEVVRELQQEFPFDYYCLMRMPFEDCLRRKAQAHIFIDKLRGPVGGGLSKSGLEAMASGVVTLCALHDLSKTNNYFDAPPTFNVNSKSDLESTLRGLLTRKDLVDLGKLSRGWIEEYCGLENGAWLKYFRRFVKL